MLSVGLYLVKSCLYVTAFYVPFILIFQRTTFFSLNRIYLVSGLLLSFVLPLCIGFTAIPAYEPPAALSFIEPMVAQTESAISLANEPSGSFTIVDGLIILYAVGIAIRLILLTFSIAGILQLKRRGERVTYGKIKVIKTDASVPFCFFNYVYLPKALDDPGILQHEVAHVRQYHWIDLWILELVSIILWFYPVMIAYKRSLKQQHEYLADRSVIDNGIDIIEYLISIKRQIELTIPSPVISEFYFKSIKNRINMLTRKRTSTYGLMAYTFVFPFVISLLMAFSPRKHFQINEMNSIQEELSFCTPIDEKNGFLLESGYGERLHPVLKVMRLHTGIDLIAKEGIPVISTEEGVVIKAELANAWGNIIIVQHNDTYSTSYSHLKSMNVRKGDQVKKGQVIGQVGHTGLSIKDHLHFELLKNGVAIDPIGHLPQIK